MMQNFTLKKVERYKKDLEKNIHNHVFNIWAFLFSPFYFLAADIFWFFVLFIFLPFLTSYLLTSLFGEQNIVFGVAAGVILSHLIAGFTANRIAQNYKEKYVKNFSDVNPDKEVDFFNVSCTRLILLGILSYGFYIAYWTWRNWKSYKEASKDDVCPIARAIFCHFTMPFLMRQMAHSLKIKGYYVFYGILFLVSRITETIIYREMEDINTIWLLSLIFLILQVLLLVPIQKQVNIFNQEVLKKQKTKGFCKGEIIFVLLGLVLSITSFKASIEKPVFPAYSEEEQDKIALSAHFIYYHTQAYGDVCQKEGYTMTKYPQDFEEYFAEDLNDLKNNLNSHGYAYDEVISGVIPFTEANTREAIYQELDILRRQAIIFAVAQQKQIKPEQVVWEDSFYEMFSLKDACAMLDETGIEFIKSGENKNYLKKYKL